MSIIKYTKVWYTVSAALLALSLAAIFVYGFNLSIDFKGGTLTQVEFQDGRPAKEDIERWVGLNDFGNFSVRPTGEFGYVIRTRELSEEEKEKLRASFMVSSLVSTIERQTTVGPTAGAELQRKALIAISVVILMIVAFITFAFRQVSRSDNQGAKQTVSSWKYGLATIIALAHDVIIPTGLFIFLGQYFAYEIDILFVTGLLAILGYSVHDTIVVFDRVRENLRVNHERNIHEPFEVTVDKSVNQTFARSINTSVTIFITLLALYIFGPTATQAFALLLIIGLIAGTYSSIFIASPLLVTFYKLQKNK